MKSVIRLKAFPTSSLHFSRINSFVVPGNLTTSLWSKYSKTYSNPSRTFLSWFACFVTPFSKIHWAFAVGLTFTGNVLPRDLFRLPEASTLKKPILILTLVYLALDFVLTAFGFFLGWNRVHRSVSFLFFKVFERYGLIAVGTLWAVTTIPGLYDL